MKIDKNEKKSKYKKQFETVDKIVAEEFKNEINTIGICHAMWSRKKQLLKIMYDIDWQTPAELNPEIIFD